MEDLNFEGLIDLLIQILQHNFSNDISAIFVGDVGIITPRAFQDSYGNQKAAVMIVPVSDVEIEETATNASVDRLFSLDIVVLVNMIPFFQAMPSEAFGERMLLRLAHKIRTFFSQSSNFSLGGNVSRVKVKDVNFTTLNRSSKKVEAFYTAAGIRMEVTAQMNTLLLG